MWKNTVEQGRPQITIWRMRIACCTLIICNTQRFSTATLVVRTPFSITLYVHCLYCYMKCQLLVCFLIKIDILWKS